MRAIHYVLIVSPSSRLLNFLNYIHNLGLIRQSRTWSSLSGNAARFELGSASVPCLPDNRTLLPFRITTQRTAKPPFISVFSECCWQVVTPALVSDTLAAEWLRFASSIVLSTGDVAPSTNRTNLDWSKPLSMCPVTSASTFRAAAAFKERPITGAGYYLSPACFGPRAALLRPTGRRAFKVR